ncbi:hypothetical protein EB72_19580 [Mycobacterium sp. SWH-M1]|nr:hypothetical protein EB72_19580 [Mycobacterium sp. SWH-M1]
MRPLGCEPHDIGVSMVVERGLARCPRCVSMADYVFIETAPHGMRYEVRCRKCGERYLEDMWPAPGAELVHVERPLLWPPDLEPVPPRDWAAEIRGHASALVEWSRAEIDEMVRRTRTIAPKRRFGRMVAAD